MLYFAKGRSNMTSKKYIHLAMKEFREKLSKLNYDFDRLKEDIDSHYYPKVEKAEPCIQDFSDNPSDIIQEAINKQCNELIKKDIIDLTKYIECDSEDFFQIPGGIEWFDENNPDNTRYFKLKPTLINKKFDNLEIEENIDGSFKLMIYNGIFDYSITTISKEVADKILNKDGLI
jgi:hypothetical protein